MDQDEQDPDPCPEDDEFFQVPDAESKEEAINKFLDGLEGQERGGNSTPTIPHMFSKRKDSGFPFGCADAAAADGRRGSNVYEVNPWLWQFGRGKPRLGGLTIEETTGRKNAVRDERLKRGWETRRRRKAADKA